MDLDTIDIKQLDSHDMSKAIYHIPDQMQEAVNFPYNLPALKTSPNLIILTGMGGSAIGGDLLQAILKYEIEIPILVNRDRTLPSYVNHNTLVLTVSYSGNTQETLEAFESAKTKGAQIVTYSTGGTLEKSAHKNNIPHIRIPGGLPPRAAIGYSFVPLLITLERLGLINSQKEELNKTIELLKNLREKWCPAVKTQDNLAKQLASFLSGSIPIIYGSNQCNGIAALRWKSQFNENSKTLALYNIFPELCHNELVGWDGINGFAEKSTVILLRDHKDPPQHKRQIELAKAIINKKAEIVKEVWAEGDSAISKLFYFILLGDYVSLYLALLSGKDPYPIDGLDWLKTELAKS